MAKYSTRSVWPVRVATFCILGYFHTMIWFRLYPCVDTISLTLRDYMRLHTWLPVSMR